MKKRTPPPVNYIRSFEASARHLSFTKAAEELGYTQAAISTHVRSLENYIGRTLFVRHARSLELTEIGEAFLPTLRQALHQIDGATDAIVKSSKEKSLVIACPMSLAESWLSGVLARFQQNHPQVEVLVHGTVWERRDEELADIVISVCRDDAVPPDCQQLIAERLVVVCAPSIAHWLKGPRDLFKVPQIVVAGRQEYFDIFAEHHGLSPNLEAKEVFRTNASNISLEFAADGLGATITLATLADRYLRRGLLVKPFDESYPSPWSYYFHLPKTRQSVSAKHFMATLAAMGYPHITR